MADLTRVALWMEIGKRVAARRKQQQMTQAELATNIGIHRIGITNLERGLQRLELSRLYDIAEWLDCEVAEFLPTRRP